MRDDTKDMENIRFTGKYRFILRNFTDGTQLKNDVSMDYAENALVKRKSLYDSHFDYSRKFYPECQAMVSR